jgi:hypothetical protein
MDDGLSSSSDYRLATDAERDAKLVRLYRHHFRFRGEMMTEAANEATASTATLSQVIRSSSPVCGAKSGRGAAADPSCPDRKAAAIRSGPPPSLPLTPPAVPKAQGSPRKISAQRSPRTRTKRACSLELLHQPPARRKVKARSYDLLDDNSRVRILGYLSPADLAETCMVSAQFRRDSFHESLPAVGREATLALSSDWGTRRRNRDEGHLRRLVSGLARRSSFGRSITALKVVLTEPTGDLSKTVVRQSRQDVVAPGITRLHLSNFDGISMLHATRALLPLLPDLRHLEYSKEGAFLPSQRDFHPLEGVAHVFRQLTHRGGKFKAIGTHLNRFENVSDLCLDDSVLYFWQQYPASSVLTDADHPRYIFDGCRLSLRRVSFRNLRYHGDESNYAPRPHYPPVPQTGLIKFVRRTPTLKWFRSDLSPENVAALRRERPDVAFVS